MKHQTVWWLEEILESLIGRGGTDQMLAEHVLYGIPSLTDLLAYIPVNTKYFLVYSGDFRVNGFLLQVDHVLVDIRVPKLFIILITAGINIICNLLIYPLYHSNKPLKHTNRVAILLIKN